MSLERSRRCLYLLRVRFAARFAAMIGLDHSPRNLPRLRMHCAATPISEAMARGVQSQDDRMVRGFHISCAFVHCRRNTKHWLLGGSEWLVVCLRLLILVWAIRIPGTGESFRSGDRLGQEYRLACLRNTRIPLVHNISGGGMGEFLRFVVLYVGLQQPSWENSGSGLHSTSVVAIQACWVGPTRGVERRPTTRTQMCASNVKWLWSNAVISRRE